MCEMQHDANWLCLPAFWGVCVMWERGERGCLKCRAVMAGGMLQLILAIWSLSL